MNYVLRFLWVLMLAGCALALLARVTFGEFGPQEIAGIGATVWLGAVLVATADFILVRRRAGNGGRSPPYDQP